MTVLAQNYTPPEPTPFVLTPRSRILVVDDDFVNRKIWEEVLQGRYTLYFAEDGHKALEIYSKTHPHLVVLDRMMPGLHGDDVMRRIRALDPNGDTKIVMHSMLESTQDQLDGMHKGADLYIPKSTDIDVAVTQIQSLLNFQKNDQSTLLFKIARDQYRKGGFSGLHIAENLYRHAALLNEDIESEKINLNQVVQNIADEAKNALHNATISYVAPPEPNYVIANADMLAHSFYAVIRHCIMMSREAQNQITLTLEKTIGEVHLTIDDSLHKIDPSQWTNIFKFECSEGTIQIGLPIAWETAQRHFGDLSLSHHENGNRYLFRFPTPEKLQLLLKK